MAQNGTESHLTSSQLDGFFTSALQQTVANAAPPADMWARIESQISDLGSSNCEAGVMQEAQGEEVVLIGVK